MSADDIVRENLRELIRVTPGENYASISRWLGRNPAYVQQYIARGTPNTLGERDRKRLAHYFRVAEDTLAKPDAVRRPDTVQVPLLAVEASAGGGRIVDGEVAIGAFGFDERWLRAVCRAKPRDLSIIKVTGDSMVPTLVDGDDVLVDRSDAAARLRDGLYVLRREDVLMIKRLALAPAARMVTIASDNPAYPSWPDCPLASIVVLGRVVWAGRRFS